MEGSAVQVRAPAAKSGKKLVCIGVINRRRGEYALLHKRCGDAAIVHAPYKVHRSVDGVDDKDVFSARAVLYAAFLAEKRRARNGGAQSLYEQSLHAPVVLGDDIARAGLYLGHDTVGVHHKLRRLAFGGNHGFKYFFG